MYLATIGEPYKQIFWAAEETPALLQSWSL